MPESGKDWPKPQSEGLFPEQNTGQHAHQADRPDIAPADCEAEVEPYPDCCQGENQIRKDTVPGARCPEKSVKNPKAAPQKHTAEQALEGSRRGHRQSRCQRPPSRGSS